MDYLSVYNQIELDAALMAGAEYIWLRYEDAVVSCARPVHVFSELDVTQVVGPHYVKVVGACVTLGVMGAQSVELNMSHAATLTDCQDVDLFLSGVDRITRCHVTTARGGHIRSAVKTSFETLGSLTGVLVGCQVRNLTDDVQEALGTSVALGAGRVRKVLPDGTPIGPLLRTWETKEDW